MSNPGSVAPPRLSLNIPPLFFDDVSPLHAANRPSPTEGRRASSTTTESNARGMHDTLVDNLQAGRRRSSLAPSVPPGERGASLLKPPFNELNSLNGQSKASSSSLAESSATIEGEPVKSGIRSTLHRFSMAAPFSNPGTHAELASSGRSPSPLSPPELRLKPSLPSFETRRRPHSTLPPREASTSSPSLFNSRLQPGIATGGTSSNTADGVQQRTPRTDSSAFDFLTTAHDSTFSRSPGQADGQSKLSTSNGKGRQRAEVPIVELRMLPITDAINMFGSTQTSSNYSLSGKVVLRVHNVIHEMSASRHPPPARLGKKNADGSVRLPEINTDSIFLDPDHFLAAYLPDDDNDDDRNLRVQEIKITSLRCTFAGYALYADHSGRFAACKLTEITEELLPEGYTVQIPAKGKSQEYEIEFNLSVPGWLPGTSLTRFGGTFYSLESNAKYTAFDSEQQHAIPSSLVPPRRASIMPSSPEEYVRDPDSFPLRWQRPQHISDDEVTSSPRSVKTRSDSTPPPSSSTSGGKTTWLGKRAKQLSIRAKSQSSEGNASPSGSSNRQNSLPNEASSVLLAPPRLYASRDFLSAYSDPLVIVIRRCREVVPVPVARMAIIGQGDANDAAIVDPPTPVAPPPQPLLASIDEHQAGLLGPPVAPTTFNVPLDPAKAAAHVVTPTRSRSNTPAGERVPRTPASNPTQSTENSVQMRHFLHRPLLHPPVEAKIPNAENGLPFSLTLSLPSYVAIDGPGSDILNFGVQIEVSRSSTWQKVRELGGLRLRDMELSCIQTERHCSVPSRTFCHAYPLPPDPHIGPFDLPIFSACPSKALSGRPFSQAEMRQRRGYDRGVVQHHVDLVQAGQAPQLSANNVERVRTTVVGPPPTPAKHGMSAGKGGAPFSRGGKEKEKESVQEKEATRSDFAPPSDDVNARRNNTGRGRRAYQTAIRGLSNLATAVMDISLDLDSGYYGASQNGEAADLRNGDGSMRNGGEGGGASKKNGKDDSTRAALYSFAGSDGHGVDLTRGRVRMAIKLPLVRSTRGEGGGAHLIPDFESPFMKTRHKLQVKLGFGFGNKPLGGEGEWGQSLVMCVPVRFTESAPREVREQFAPMPIKHVAVGRSDASDALPDLSSAPSPPRETAIHATPVLPSYNQIFREDGSRLADEGEDLPQYPGPRVLPSTAGSVIAASEAQIDEADRSGETDNSAADSPGRALRPQLTAIQMNERSSSLPGSSTLPAASSSGQARTPLLSPRMHSFDNRIAPSHVLDESIPASMRGQPSARAMQRMEMEELHRDEQEDQVRRRQQSLTLAAPDGLCVSVDDRNENSSGAEEDGSSSGADDALMQGETVNVDEFDGGMDGEIPAYAAPSTTGEQEGMTFTTSVTPTRPTAHHPRAGTVVTPRHSDTNSVSSTIF